MIILCLKTAFKEEERKINSSSLKGTF